MGAVIPLLEEQPSPGAGPGPSLDFIVIGTQKGGTTSLWQYLRSHPGLVLPAYKEMPIFAAPGDPAEMLARLIDDLRRDAPPGALFGKACPLYMRGSDEVGVERIVERIARLLPDVRLIALLRDPIERAISHYRMSVRRGWESRELDAAVEELLEPGRLARSRAEPSEVNSYLTQGEYGRILAIYRGSFPPEQVRVEASAELSRDPGAVVDRVLDFLGLPPGHRPGDLGTRYFPGGARPRLDSAAEGELFAFLEKNVWPKLAAGEEDRVRLVFNFFYQTWNVVPDDEGPSLSASNRERLEQHYAADAERLGALGIGAPWLEEWRRTGDPGSGP